MHYFDLTSLEGFPFDPEKEIELAVRYDDISKN